MIKCISGGTRMFAGHKSTLGRSNAFPDAIKFEGVEYLAFRSASLHFPTSSSKIIILSKRNDVWQVEKEFKVEGHDVRNPKFYINDERLRIVFAVTPSLAAIGKRSMIFGTEKGASDVWSNALEVNLPGTFSPYRIRHVGSTPVMSAFIDYLNISDMCALPQVRFLQAEGKDKWNDYKPFADIHLCGTETDFIELTDKYYFVSRMDFSIDKRAGTNIMCFDTASGKTIEKTTRIRLDAPFLFSHSGRLFLLARRNLFFKGRYDLLPKWVPDTIRTIINGAIYWLTPKSLALWEVNTEDLTVKYLLSFPVQGDTGYAVAQKSSDSSYNIYTYSSTWGKYMPWIFGQFGRTEIMQFRFQFT